MKRLITASPLALAGVGGAVVLIGATAAFAAWGITSEEFSFTNTAATLSKGNRPAVSADGNTVTISWIPTKVVGSTTVEGYRIKRYDDADTAQQPTGACETLVVQANCMDSEVPVGSWRYTVVPVQGTWAGPESGKSARVTVNADRSVVVEPLPGETALPTTAVGATTGAATPGAATSTPAPGGSTPGPEGSVVPPAWTLAVGDDGVLNGGDTLTLAGSDPLAPGDFAAGWDGGARTVTVVAEAGSPDRITVHDGPAAGAGATIGPLPVGTAYVAMDTTRPGRMVARDGTFVVTLDKPATAEPAPPAQEPPPPAEPPAVEPPSDPGTPVTQESAEQPVEPETPKAEVTATAASAAEPVPTVDVTQTDGP